MRRAHDERFGQDYRRAEPAAGDIAHDLLVVLMVGLGTGTVIEVLESASVLADQLLDAGCVDAVREQWDVRMRTEYDDEFMALTGELEVLDGDD